MKKLKRFWYWLLGYPTDPIDISYYSPIYMGPNFSCSCGASGRGKSEDHKCLDD